MRTEEAPMTADEFETALDDAKRGLVVSDTGATDTAQAALDAVAEAAPNPPDELVEAARTAFQTLSSEWAPRPAS